MQLEFKELLGLNVMSKKFYAEVTPKNTVLQKSKIVLFPISPLFCKRVGRSAKFFFIYMYLKFFLSWFLRAG